MLIEGSYKIFSIYRTNPANDVVFVPALTNISVSSTVRTFPVIKLVGPTTNTAQLKHIFNYTSGKYLYFEGLDVQPNEVIIIDFRPGYKTITSNLRGSLHTYVTPASNFNTFDLSPANNVLSIASSGSNFQVSLIQYTEEFNSINSLAR